MNNHSRSKSQLFLLEFTIVVLFFAICATICVSAFVKADQLSKNNEIEMRALLNLQSVAEIIKATDFEEPGRVGLNLAEYLGAKVEKQQGNGEKYRLFYDEELAILPEQNADCKYTMDVEITYSEGNIMTAKLSMIQNSSMDDSAEGEEMQGLEVSNLVVKKYLCMI